jgi:hypothetical protein
MISHKATALVSASAALAGSQAITDADGYHRHAALVTLTAAGSVQFEASTTGARWVPAGTPVTASGLLGPLEGVYPMLRVAWTGNNGAVTVDLIQSDDNPVAAR